MTYNPWSRDRIDRLAQLVADGFSASEIARAMHSASWQPSRNSIIGKCNRMNLSLKGQSFAHHPSGPRNPELAARIRQLVASGHDAHEIAATTGLSVEAARQRASRMGLRIARSGPPRPRPQNRVATVFGKSDGKTRKQHIAEGQAALAMDPAVLSPNTRPWAERGFGQCAYPLGEKGAVQSCCNPVGSGTAMQARYCPPHYAVMAPSGPPERMDRQVSRLTRFDRVERSGTEDGDLKPLDLAVAA